MEKILGPASHPSVAPVRIEERQQYRYAFKLAWFLHPNAKIAENIARNSILGLPDTYSAQARRAEYTPKGLFRTPVSMERDHLLQRRVFKLSVEYEVQRENSARITAEDLTVYFIKEALRMAMNCASFQVMVSIGRILHSYRTREVMNMYGTVAPNRSGKKNDDQCRDWKKQAMDYLEDRFGRFVSMTIGPHNEKRFIRATDEKILALAKECLRLFMPCHTSHPIPENCGRIAPDHLHHIGAPDDEHTIELLRFHAAICPLCFLYLTAGWDLASPDDRSSIPAFNPPPQDVNEDYLDRGNPPELTDAEVDRVLDEIAAEKERRRKVSPSKLRVFVDGVETSVLDLDAPNALSLKPGRDAEIIELISEVGDVLVSHLLTRGDEDFPVTTTAEYRVGELEFTFVEDQGSVLHERLVDIRGIRFPQVMYLSAGCIDSYWGAGKSHLLSRLVSERFEDMAAFPELEKPAEELPRPRALVLWGPPGCGKTMIARMLARYLGWSAMPRIAANAFNAGVEGQPVAAVSDLRVKLDAIEALTRLEATLYRDFRILAKRRGVKSEKVPSISEREEKLSRLSLSAGVFLSGLATALLSLRSPWGALGLLPLISLALAAWRHFKWTSRITWQYKSVNECVEYLQRSLWRANDEDPVHYWSDVFSEAEKVAFLVGRYQEPDVLCLGSALRSRGFEVKILDSAISACHAIIRRRLSSLSGRSTHFVYFAGHGDFSEDLTMLREASSFKWLHAGSLYQRVNGLPVLHGLPSWKERASETPLFFVNACGAGDSLWSALSLAYFNNTRFMPKESDYDRARSVCTWALIDALMGSAAGRDGLVTVSDIETYLKRRLNDVGKIKVRAQFSETRSRDILLSTMPARASPDREKE
jgi:hypothetical protein